MVSSQVRTVSVLVGGSSATRDESLQSGQDIVQSLQSQGLAAHTIDITDPNLVAELRNVDVIFVSLLGEMGENGAAQGFLQFLQIPQTCSGLLGSALCANKLLTKQVYEFHGIPTPKYRIVNLRESLPEQLKSIRRRRKELSFPVVVKPVSGSYGKGITFVSRDSDLEQQ